MPYNPLTDFIGLWRAVSGGVEKAEMPGLDFVVQALSRAGLVRVVTSATAPIANQRSTAWFKPATPSFMGEGTLFLWNESILGYSAATPELYHALMTSGDTVPGGGGGGDGIEEAPDDGKQYGRQSKSWTEVVGSTTIPPSEDQDMAIISSTPPASPASGTQWWNGEILQIWDGGMWQAVGPTLNAGGDPIATSTLTFAITQPLAAATAGATWTVVPYTSSPQIEAQAGSWDPVTKKLTPKKAGMYMFNARAVPVTAGGIAILKNDDGTFNSTASDVVLAISSASTQVWQSVSGVSPMNGTTDYVRIFAYSSANSLAAAGSNPVFSALMLP